MGDDEEQLFLQEMSEVRPLQHRPRVSSSRAGAASRDASQSTRREAAVQTPEQDRNSLSEEGVVALDPWYVLDFKRPGIQHGVYRKLRQGRYPPEAKLDMHRMTVAVARRELFEFIEESLQLGLRSVIVVHGKGENKVARERSSILKGCTDHWLRQLDPVQAFCSAQAQYGGTGATYVLLRKSAEKKRENRLKFAKGRVPWDEQ